MLAEDIWTEVERMSIEGFRHISRKTNEVAHGLVRKACEEGLSSSWSLTCPTWLSVLLNIDFL